MPKLDSLRLHALSTQPDIIALTETWLSCSIHSNEICIPGYTIIRRDRNRHGGILMFCRNELQVNNIIADPNIELLSVEFSFNHGPLLVCLFYRPPSAPTSLRDDLDHALTAIPPVKLKSAILLGDFNIDLLPSHHPVTNPSFQAL